MESPERLPIVLRAPRPSDLAFVHDSWRHSLSEAKTFQHMEPLRRMNRLLDGLTKVLGRSMVVIACLESDDDEIAGYGVYDADAVHWCYVKYPYRRFGVMRAMLTAMRPNIGTDITVVSNTCRRFSELRWKFRLEYDPWPFWRAAT